MTEHKPGFIATVASYPRTFWVANTMEIFERMSWYGWFTVMALYVTGSVETGGLGFSTEQRGMLQAVVPCILYLLPVLTGALADRFGFKRTFIIAYIMMMAAYYLLGQFTTLPTFFVAFLFVAVSAATFKPVVVGTVAKVTDESNSAMAFGIFYMMVNIGGFVGPIVAGYVRGWGWQYVFMACACWAFINLLIVIFLYREPKIEGMAEDRRTLRKVGEDLVEVLGNVRFGITVGASVVGLMVASALSSVGVSWFTWNRFLAVFVVWIVINCLYDLVLPAGSGRPAQLGGPKRFFLLKRMHCSNWRFALFLLIMSGFWTAFNQIFYTMPEYIRDFTNTRPMIHAAESIVGKSDPEDPTKGVASAMATINESERAVVRQSAEKLSGAGAGIEEKQLEEISHKLIESKVRLTPEKLRELAGAYSQEVEKLTDQLIIQGRQVNPEFIVNIDALAIVFFQVLISFLMAKFHRFTTMIVGMLIAAVGIGLSFFAGDNTMLGTGGSVWVVALGLFIFAIGEMMASPTSQEYVGRIAPRDKIALYMGYYFVAVALGNLFGGILSGQLYGKLARDMQRPDLMWAAFGGIMVLTALLFVLYDRFALPRNRSATQTANQA